MIINAGSGPNPLYAPSVELGRTPMAALQVPGIVGAESGLPVFTGEDGAMEPKDTDAARAALGAAPESHLTTPNAHSGQFANALTSKASGATVQLADVQPYTKVQGLTLFGQTTETAPNLIQENRRKFEGWVAYQEAVVTLTQNQSVVEWGTDEATRIQTSGGTAVIKYRLSLATSDAGLTYASKVYIKNTGTNWIVNSKSDSNYTLR